MSGIWPELSYDQQHELKKQYKEVNEDNMGLNEKFNQFMNAITK